ncbi:MAG: 3-dehydroquinate synthase [Candidatus Berkiella sp.]
MEEPLWVTVPSGAYPVFIGYDLLAKASLFQQHIRKAACIISHPEIAAHYFPRLEKALIQAGVKKMTTLLLPSGESHKTLVYAEKIWSYLLTQHYHRDTSIVALGGGMIGDLAGFSAACYMRGIDVIHCPTSLLAQVDAVIGGKTAVNHPLGKNMIGVFHQPKMVLADLSTLSTLPQREFIAGIAELIKYGLVLDPAFFAWLEENLSLLLARDSKALHHVVITACRIKAEVVRKDERDTAERIVLNFGHTIAHAIENSYDYEKYLHGEAVAMGMMVAMRLSLELGWGELNLLERLISLLTKAGLPISLPDGITTAAIFARIRQDKKHSNGQIGWVLVESLGKARVIEDVPESTVRAVLEASGATP